MILEAEEISCGYKKEIFGNLSFGVEPGEFIGVIGPNGCGKSTLLKALYGYHPPLKGCIKVLGKPLSSYTGLQLARVMAVMPQDPPEDSSFLAEEVVAFARHPFTNGLGWLGKEDEKIIEEAMLFAGASGFRGRLMSELSGGERQRVRFARAIAQSPRLLLLDEPTTHMDLNRQLELLDLTARICREGVTAIAVLHDLNQAAQFCSRLLLFSASGLLADGVPRRVITEENLAASFGVPVQVCLHPQSGAPYLLPRLTINKRAKRGRLHVVAGGGSGKSLIPELYRMGFELSVGVVNALDSDAELAASLGIPLILEAPFSPISPENSQLLREQIARSEAVVVALTEYGEGNLPNLEALSGARKIFFTGSLEAIEKHDHTGGKAANLYAERIEGGAVFLSEEDLFSFLAKEHRTVELRLFGED
ncbi:MAG TPA: ABC transporter ATP-binding protein [Chroococcales cyanobacterium]